MVSDRTTLTDSAGQLRLKAGKDWLRGTQLGSDALTKGVYGDILGVQLVRSRKLDANEAYLVKVDGALLAKLATRFDYHLHHCRYLMRLEYHQQ